jgi:hypothetical protein
MDEKEICLILARCGTLKEVVVMNLDLDAACKLVEIMQQAIRQWEAS